MGNYEIKRRLLFSQMLWSQIKRRQVKNAKRVFSQMSSLVKRVIIFTFKIILWPKKLKKLSSYCINFILLMDWFIKINESPTLDTYGERYLLSNLFGTKSFKARAVKTTFAIKVVVARSMQNIFRFTSSSIEFFNISRFLYSVQSCIAGKTILKLSQKFDQTQ